MRADREQSGLENIKRVKLSEREGKEGKGRDEKKRDR